MPHCGVRNFYCAAAGIIGRLDGGVSRKDSEHATECVPGGLYIH